MKNQWITAAIAGGGRLIMWGPLPGNRMVKAIMRWEDEVGDEVEGDMSLNIDGALENLEKALSQTEEAKDFEPRTL